MKIIFFGTPDFVLPVVEAIYKNFQDGREKSLVAVVTQAPKPTGRKKMLTYSPIDTWAHNKKIEVIYDLDNIPQVDLGVVAAYGKIIPEKVISQFKYGLVNIHPSLLPSLRGASPIQAALALGLKETGVSFIKMDAEMDHGPIISQFKEEINFSDTNTTLRSRLFEKASGVLVDLLPAYMAGKIKLVDQDHSKATFTRLIQKSDGYIPPHFLKSILEGKKLNSDWNLDFIKDASTEVSKESIFNRIKAFEQWPNCWTNVKISTDKIKALKIITAHLEENLVLDQVQLEGKNIVSWRQFQEGHPDFKFEEN